MLEEDRADTRARYGGRYREFGYDPRTLGWHKGRQRVRFAAALAAVGTGFGSLLDVGCGFGDLFGYLRDRGWQGDYLGLDICAELLDEGRKRFGPRGARFECIDLSCEPLAFSADVAVALGIFNHRLKGDNLEFAGQMLHAMWAHSTHAIVVDFLSTAADRPKPDLFHADPDVVLRMALGYSKRVRLDHSYMPFEFLVAMWHDDSYSADCPVFAPYLPEVRPQPAGKSAAGPSKSEQPAGADLSSTPTSDPKRNRARELAQTHVARGDAVGWFEPLYAEAQGDAERVPWADRKPNPNLVEWLDHEAIRGDGRTALVVGCGLGDDAELLAARGFRVTAFDVAPSAVAWCRRRFPTSSVDYQAADLLNPPQAWSGAFDFVFEAYTLQVLKAAGARSQAISRLAAFPSPCGTLLVVCRGRDAGDPEGQMPWPLLRDELSALETGGLVRVDFEDFFDQHETPPVRRFRARYSRPASGGGAIFADRP